MPREARRAPVLVLVLLALGATSPAAAEEDEPGRRCPVAAPGAMGGGPACAWTHVSADVHGAAAAAEVGTHHGHARAGASAPLDSGAACASADATDAKPPLSNASAALCPGAPAAPAPAMPSLPGAPAAPDARPPSVAPAPAPAPVPVPAPAPAPVVHRASAHLDEAEGLPTLLLATALATPAGETGAVVGSRPAAASRAADGAAPSASPVAAARTEALARAAPAASAATPPLARAPDASLAPDAAPAPRGGTASAAAAAVGAAGAGDAARGAAWAAAAGAALLVLARLLAGAAWALYHRLGRHELARHPTRAAALAALADAPATATALARRLGANRKTLEHHLRLMAAGGLVTSWTEGRERLFAVAPAAPPRDALSPGARRVLAARREAPAASVGELARRLGVSKGTVHHHLARLRAAGLSP